MSDPALNLLLIDSLLLSGGASPSAVALVNLLGLVIAIVVAFVAFRGGSR